MKILELFLSFARDESGSTAIEYALLTSMIALAILGSLFSMRASLATLFSTVSGAVGGSIAGG
ncbi:MAG: Flp family type IVb pilin [Rhodospirillales bacterium]|nr:Flp family type IVb pilin [Rhodospirillales bacterium]